MNKDTRNTIERATQRARMLLEEDFAAQLEGDFDVHRDGKLAANAGSHLSARQASQRERIVAAIEHKRATTMIAADSVADYLRDAAFTTLNRFVALKMLEARELVQECITKGEQSAGYREFYGMAPGLPLLPESAGYRFYIESLFDELSTEIKVLFDRRDPSSVLWPKRATFDRLLEILNAGELAAVWGEDETIGWVYQFFNGQDERRKMREDNPAPRNSRELAIRNQFFTPRYIVQFLADNTLGRIWHEMCGGKTALDARCEYMVRKPNEKFAPRPRKDPRDLRVLDPACGSGHFLLYAFDLFVTIYREAHADAESPKSEVTGRTLAEDYPTLEALQKAIPGLVLAHNLHGVDIDPRCAQIGQLALWMRAQKAFHDFGIGRPERPRIRRSNIVVAEPLVADEQIAREFVTKLGDAELGRVFSGLVKTLSLAGDMGFLIRAETLVAQHAERADTGDFLAPPEERIRAALARFASDNDVKASTRRRLFVDDASHGTGLLSISELKYDVVLMNPPFGAPTNASSQLLGVNFPDSRYDIGAAFIEEGTRRLSTGGLLGAIFNRTNWFLFRLGRFRERQIREHWLPNNVDLGLGVLDAFVETALTIISQAPSVNDGVWFRVVDVDAKADTLLAAIQEMARGVRSARVFEINQAAFNATQSHAYSYWIPSDLLEDSARTKLSSLGFEAKQGLATKDNFRFLRLHWEVNPRSARGWRLYSKGGTYAPLAGSFHLVIDWSSAAQAAFANRDGQFCCLLTGQAARYLFRPGVTYSQRTARFSARLFPRGGLFDTKGSVVFAPGTIATTDDDSEILSLCLLLNTEVAQFIFDLSAGASDEGKARDYSQGMVSALPTPRDAASDLTEVLPRAREIVSSVIQLASSDPTSIYFVGLPKQTGAAISERITSIVGRAHRLQEELDDVLRRTSEIYANAIGIGPEAEAAISESVKQTHRKSVHDGLNISEELVSARLRQSLLIESLAGKLTTEQCRRVAVCEKDLLQELPWGGLASLDGVLGILVDDPGHPANIASAVVASAELGGLSLEALGIEDLHGWLRTEAFEEHVAMFSRSKRIAPVAWCLSTASRSYSVWLYIHAFKRDTLFRIQHDYVVPKLTHEQRRLELLTSDLQGKAAATQRRELIAQEAFVEDLRTFRDEVGRVASLWNPNLDDGVTISFAPLWRLVP